MSGDPRDTRTTHDAVERRLASIRAQLRARHAGIEPDPHFAARVAARLPRVQDEPFRWAARRVLTASLTLAAVLCAFVLADLARGRAPASSSAPAGTATVAPTGAATGATGATAETGDDELLAFILGSEEAR